MDATCGVCCAGTTTTTATVTTIPQHKMDIQALDSSKPDNDGGKKYCKSFVGQNRAIERG